ncbi:hypothetical protein HanPI659440_Chr09g0334021 [Helianthus annuus]|nr:hypothetical protein HanPI659440_Chr09g0334021 [Helianthus annuus]
MRRLQIHKPSCLHFHPHGHKLPCLDCNPHDFIRMVHHLIERCIVFRMGRDECMRTLAKHANISPVVTFTGIVWKYIRIFFRITRVFTFVWHLNIQLSILL